MRKIALCLVISLLMVAQVVAQDEAAAEQSMSFLALVGSALVWATFAIFVSQLASIGVMWLLGLPPKKLTHEIEDVQNPAVGAVFFIISLTASIFVGFMTTSGFTPDPPFLESAAWIIGGLILGFVYTVILYIAAHRIMGRLPNENVYGYIRREIVLEQNASLAFFLGGLTVSPFISIVFQLL
jgi:drug/metabolite transporter (DMT)-like permease